MRVIFRVDASTQIGTGHVMRCLVLAEQLRKRKAEVRFICCDLQGNLMQFIREQGFEVKPLIYLKKDSEHSQDILDAQATVEEIRQDHSIDYLVIDHYGFDYRWERVVKPFVGKLMVIDDLANRRHDCDCLVDQNLLPHPNRYQSQVNKEADLLVGPKYLMLREEFIRAPLPSASSQSDPRILVSFGGSDPTNETVKTMEALMLIPYEVQVDIIIGAVNPSIDKIQSYAKKYPFFHIYTKTRKIASMMAKSDLAIGAGGTTTWERCYLQLPTITIETAANQHTILTHLHGLGYLHHLGESKEVTVHDIEEAVITYLENPLQLKQMTNLLKNYSSMVQHGAVARYITGGDS